MMRYATLAALLAALLTGCGPAEPPPAGTRQFDRMATPAFGTTRAYPFAQPSPDYRLQFPRDHAAHPQYRIEWWYITANLQDAGGAHYGVQWTQFRSAVPAQAQTGEVQLQQFYMAHAAIGSRRQHLAAEKFGRDDIGTAGIQPAPFSAYIDHWEASSEQPESLFPLRIRFAAPAFGADLRLTRQGPVMLQGDHGYSRKDSANTLASHYYSMPWLEISGSIRLDGRETAVSGQAWLDREWTSTLLAPGQQGWDWLALHLDDGSALMLYQLRHTQEAPFRFAKWMAKNGDSRTLSPQSIDMQPLAYSSIAGRQIPTRWRIVLPEIGLDVTVTPLYEGQYLALSQPYWEGAVFIQGSHSGRGFLEMTGY